MKKVFSILLFLIASICFAGGEKENFEEKAFDSLQSIEQKITSNPEQAIEELNDVIRYTIAHDLEKPQAYAYLLLGRTYKELKQPKLALQYVLRSYPNTQRQKKVAATKSVEKMKSQRSEPLLVRPNIYYLELAEVYQQLGEYTLSNDNYLRYRQGITADNVLNDIDFNIGGNYYALEDYSNAIETFERLLNRPSFLEDNARVNECYSYLSASYISKGDTEEGLKYYKLSTEIVAEEELSDDVELYQNISSNKEIVSKALRTQNKLEEELDIREQAIEVVDNSVDYLRLAQTYYSAKNLNETVTSLDKYFDNISYDLIDRSEIEVIKQTAYDLRNDNPSKALDYMFQYEKLLDTIDRRLDKLELKTNELGTKGNQDILQLEILQKDKEISKNTIEHLMRESKLKEDVVSFQKTIIYLLLAIVVLGILTLFFVIRVSKQRRIANQKLALRSLRTQMNPHFIFNALNSVNSFISTSDVRSANKFLTAFSTLMRTVMENSEYEFISLTKELEIVKIYIELEHFRFKDKFSYDLVIDEDIDTDAYILPPMLVQPYIENAVWHGLRYKEEKGTLKISFQKLKQALQISIVDDGVGREKSQELKTKNQKKTKSTALKNINERIQLFSKLHNIKVEVTIEDLYENGTGTVVTLIIPQTKHGADISNHS